MKEQTTIAGYNAYVYNPGVSAPVLLAFHGKGEMGTNPANLLRAGLPQMMHAQDFTPPKPVYVICPQAPDGAFPADKIPQLLNAVKAKYPQADITKVYTTGFSFGGQTVMEGLVHKPLHALPMSAAAGGNTLVNFIADNRIPITHWTGGNELDNIGWTLYQVNQKVPGLTKTIVRPGIGHCCWNEVLQSAAFWDLIKVDSPPVPTPEPTPEPQPNPEPGITVSAGSDIVSEKTTVNLRAEISGPYRSLRWDVISVPAGVGLVYNIASPTTTGTTFTTMAYGEYIIRLVVTDTNGKQHVDDVKVNIKRPVVTAPVPVGKVKINGFELVMMDKGIYTGTRVDLEVEYNGTYLKLTKNGNWQKVK